MMKHRRAIGAMLLAALLLLNACPLFSAAAEDEVITLRICNWEEYIDLGGWDDGKDSHGNYNPDNDETIDLESGDIFGENSMVEDFEAWYFETYGIRVRVEYSTFGTNEDLYNMLTIGDVYDLVCPSEYMIMKLMAEDKVQPLSEGFFDEENENNYYIRGVSPYIRSIFESHEINGVSWDKCAAGYMWGITGFVYNPEVVSEADASTWRLMQNPAYHRQITMKDNVRDSYFAAVGALKSDLLTSEDFTGAEDYAARLQDEMNDVSPETVNAVQEYLQDTKDNLYSFETDSGKADMITGKVVANYQWSGDAVYTMDQAEEDEYYLNFAVPRESTNIYFDGWVMLRKGIDGDAKKQHAAEAFINFISRPDNAIRNMYYIGYTSTISGGEDGRIFEYLEWTYGADDEEGGGDEGETESAEAEPDGEAAETAEAAEDVESVETVEAAETIEVSESAEAVETVEAAGTAESAESEEADGLVAYDVSYFFAGEGSEGEYVLMVEPEQLKRQLSAQYPSEDVIRRASIMVYFNAEQSEIINRMWIRVRCFNIQDVPVWVWIALAALIAGGVAFRFRRKAAREKMYR